MLANAMVSYRLSGHFAPYLLQRLRGGGMLGGQPGSRGAHDALELVGQALCGRFPDRAVQRLGGAAAVVGKQLDVRDGDELDDAPLLPRREPLPSPRVSVPSPRRS